MIEVHEFVKGVLLGMIVALPIGPMATLCIWRTLEKGRGSGFMTGLGATLADTVYAAIGAFSLSMISGLLLSAQMWLRLMGGVFLIYLGIKSFISLEMPKFQEVIKASRYGDFFSTFLLTLANPTTMFAYVALFAGLGVGELKGNYPLASTLVAGVFVGAGLSWTFFVFVVSFFRKRITSSVFVWIKRICGALLMLFGIIALVSSFI